MVIRAISTCHWALRYLTIDDRRQARDYCLETWLFGDFWL